MNKDLGSKAINWELFSLRDLVSFSFSGLEKRANSSLFGLRQSARSKWQRRDFIVKATFAHLLAIRYKLELQSCWIPSRYSETREFNLLFRCKHRHKIHLPRCSCKKRSPVLMVIPWDRFSSCYCTHFSFQCPSLKIATLRHESFSLLLRGPRLAKSEAYN